MTKENNRMTFQSEQFGQVQLVKRSISIRHITYDGEQIMVYRGQLVNNWSPSIITPGGLCNFRYRKGQLVYLNMKFFQVRKA